MTYIYDLTNERWIVHPNSRMPRGSGLSAELGDTHKPAHTRPAVILSPTAGRLGGVIVDTLTTLLGLLVFGFIAGFFLLLA